MGRDKALLPAADPVGGPVAGRSREERSTLTLSARTAAILSRCCSPAVEVGPGHTVLTSVTEPEPGQGPLAAIAAGWRALGAAGWRGPVVVLATDLPNLTDGMVTWLAGRAGTRSVVPTASGRVQPLCARYCPADLDRVADLLADGRRAMTALLDASDPELVPEDEWASAAGGVGVLADVDTPEDLRRVTGQ